MFRARPKTLLAVLLVAGVTGSLAWTCCMAPLTYPGDVDQSRQDAVIFHDGTTEDLIVGVAPVFPEGNGPERLLWILTTPTPPTDYGEVDRAVFKEAEELARKLSALKAREVAQNSKSAVLSNQAAGSIDALEFADAVQVGPYTITEVRAKDGVETEGAAQLNQFLSDQGYPAEPVEEIEWFTSRGFSFLCIEIRPPDGAKTFSAETQTPALRVTFESDRVYYPAKYSARQGDFALGLTVFSTTPLSDESVKSAKTRLNSHDEYANLSTSDPLPNTLAKVVEESKHLGAHAQWYVTPFPSWGFNATVGGSDVGAIAQWKDDVFLDLEPAIGGPKMLGLFVMMVLGAIIGSFIGLRMRRKAQA